MGVSFNLGKFKLSVFQIIVGSFHLDSLPVVSGMRPWQQRKHELKVHLSLEGGNIKIHLCVKTLFKSEIA